MKVDDFFMYQIFVKDRYTGEEYKYLVENDIFVKYIWLAPMFSNHYVGVVEMNISQRVVELFESNFMIVIEI